MFDFGMMGVLGDEGDEVMVRRMAFFIRGQDVKRAKEGWLVAGRRTVVVHVVPGAHCHFFLLLPSLSP